MRWECEIAGGVRGGVSVPALQFRCFGVRFSTATEIARQHSKSQLSLAGCDFAKIFPLLDSARVRDSESGTLVLSFSERKNIIAQKKAINPNLVAFKRHIDSRPPSGQGKEPV